MRFSMIALGLVTSLLSGCYSSTEKEIVEKPVVVQERVFPGESVIIRREKVGPSGTIIERERTITRP